MEQALLQLGVDRSAVEIVVLREGRPGFLGIGGEEARVRVTVIEPEDVEEIEPPPIVQVDPVAVAQEVLEEIVDRLQFQAAVHRVTAPPGGLDVRGDGLGLLIGRRGETLRALQFLVNHLVSRRLKRRVFVPIDVASYQHRRQEALERLAHRAAEQVSRTGQPLTLEPMSPRERRIIHLALADHKRVTTQSVGEGEKRRVVIMPREGAGSQTNAAP